MSITLGVLALLVSVLVTTYNFAYLKKVGLKLKKAELEYLFRFGKSSRKK